MSSSPLTSPEADLLHPWIWAPAAERVSVEICGSRPDGELIGSVAMTRDESRPGRWTAPEALEPGVRYRFSVDGTSVPDPRSAWQPDGVHGPSVVVDHMQYDWTDAGWRAPPLAAAVIYEVHIGTFTPAGTYAGAVERLDVLVELGVTHIELMPLATFDGTHGWGYDGVDLYAPHPAYGTPDELKAFVAACHERGLAVFLDVVYNHLGPVGNHLGVVGPYFTDRYETPWGSAVNLDGPGSDEVRRFLVDNALMWLRDYHMDGLRLDAVHALVDTGARHLLEQLADEVGQLADHLDRPLVLIAENDTNDPRLVRPFDQGGLGLDAHWCDDVHHAIHTVLTGESGGYYADYAAADGFAVLERALGQGYVYDGRYSPARDRVVGRSPEHLRGRNLVACIQNHDQIGNRARGERLSHLTSFAAQQVAAALLLTGPFIPLLFQGEEWASSSPFPYFADHQDPDLADAVRRGRRNEFAALGWRTDEVLDPEAPETFSLAVLPWDERGDGEHAVMWRWYRDLIALRRSTPDLLDDRLDATRVSTDEVTRTVVVERGRFTLFANLSGSEQAVEVNMDDIVLASSPVARGDGTLVLAPLSVAIGSRKRP